jgi:hypothetical protein
VGCAASGGVCCVWTRGVIGRRWKVVVPLGRDTEFERRQGRKRQKEGTEGVRAYWRGGILKLLGKHYLFITDTLLSGRLMNIAKLKQQAISITILYMLCLKL